MLSRFGIVERLDYYPAEELAEVVRRSARLLQIELHDDAALELARRARGTPRIANRLLRRARDFATVLGDGAIDRRVADEALDAPRSRRRRPRRHGPAPAHASSSSITRAARSASTRSPPC